MAAFTGQIRATTDTPANCLTFLTARIAHGLVLGVSVFPAAPGKYTVIATDSGAGAGAQIAFVTSGTAAAIVAALETAIKALTTFTSLNIFELVPSGPGTFVCFTVLTGVV